MKRTLIPLLAVLSLAACGQQESPPAATQSEPAAPAEAAAPAPAAAVLKSGEDVYSRSAWPATRTAWPARPRPASPAAGRRSPARGKRR
ncbi:MAG: hypothetical protein AB1418_12600 [Pseudomonadota bacterium]